MLYWNIALSREFVERVLQPVANIVADLERLFVGNVKIEDVFVSRHGEDEAPTALELLTFSTESISA